MVDGKVPTRLETDFAQVVGMKEAKSDEQTFQKMAKDYLARVAELQ